MVSGFDCWANQPALADLEQFILTDLGTHVLDVARVLFGEANSLYCLTQRTLAPRVKGENVATLLLSMGTARTSVAVEMAYAKTPLEPSVRECFPQTLAFIEGPKGSLELCADYVIHLTTSRGTQITRHAPPRYAWANPAYDIAHASMVPCNADLLAALRGEGMGETTGEDNLRTLELVFGAYESAKRNVVVKF
jgi:predicted dehydrogenase